MFVQTEWLNEVTEHIAQLRKERYLIRRQFVDLYETLGLSDYLSGSKRWTLLEYGKSTEEYKNKSKEIEDYLTTAKKSMKSMGFSDFVIDRLIGHGKGIHIEELES